MIYSLKSLMFIELVLFFAVFTFGFSLRVRYRDLVAAGNVAAIFVIPIFGLFGRDKNIFYAFLIILPLLWTANPVRLPRRYLLALLSFPELAGPYIIEGVYLGRWSAILALNAGAFIALAAIRRQKLRTALTNDIAFWLLFVVAIIMASRGMSSGGVARAIFINFFLIVPPYFVVSRTIRSIFDALDVLSLIVLGGVSNAAIGMFESFKHWSLYESFNSGLHVRPEVATANLAVRAGLLRAGGAFVNYETLGLVCGIAILAAIVIRDRFTAVGNAAILAMLGSGLLVSQARSAWIATFVGLILQAAFDRRWRRAVTMAACVGAAGAATLVASFGSDRIGQLIGRSGHGETSSQYRQDLLTRGLEEARRHPLTGQTLTQLQLSMNDLRQGEHIIDFVNTHLFVMLVGGIGALLIWLVSWVVPLMTGWRYRRGTRQEGTSIAAFAFGATGMTFLFLALTSPVDRILPLAVIVMAFTCLILRLPRPHRIDRRTARSHPSLRGGDFPGVYA